MRANSLTIAIALLLFPVAQSALAQDGGTYSWERPKGAAEATLTLSGAQGSQQMVFAAGESVQVNAAALSAGGYKWELVYAPVVPAALKAQTMRNREAGDTALPAQWPSAIEARSGSLRVSGGQFVAAVLESAAAAEQGGAVSVAKAAPIAGDQTIRNSACVGGDCVNNEIYGADTIRLKENNSRIHFDDTSGGGSFPSNDWRIRINDSVNGGDNYFAVEDTTAGRTPFLVEAGAIANALYVESTGDVGIGTNNPTVELHAVDGNSPTLRLQQDGTNGFTPYAFDIAANETNFFVRDVNTGRLPFKIRPGAGESSFDLDDTGNIGFGVANASAALHIRRNIAASYLLVERVAGDRRMELDNSGNLYVGGTITQLSSRHSKENLATVAGSALLAKLRSLELWTWNYRTAADNDRHIGPVAEDFYATFGLGTDDRSLAPADVAGVALAASQALSAQIEQRDEHIATLEERIARLETALEKISSAQR